MTTSWITREQIGMAPANVAHLTPRRSSTPPLVGATVHHTDTAWVRNRHDALNAWKQIQASAMNGSLPSGDRYGDTPYAAGIDDWGGILVGRDQGHYVGAHATSTGNHANVQTFGVAYIGGDAPTPAAIEALRAYLWLVAFTLHRPTPIVLMTHREWNQFGGISTACPGNRLQAVTEQIRRQITG